jgi:DNA-binding NarL/FixJ family response regulator
VIAEDSILREPLTQMLQAGGYTVPYAARSGDELLAHLHKSGPPDVAVLDIRMPPRQTDEGVVTAERIRQRWPSVAILLYSAHTIAPMAERLLAIDGDGGLGYVTKDQVCTAAGLHAAVERVAAGEQVLDPQLVSQLLRRRRQKPLHELLTEREYEVLGAIASGLTNQAIAVKLGLKVKTVEEYCGSLFAKLGLSSSPQYNQRVRAVLEWFRHNQ